MAGPGRSGGYVPSSYSNLTTKSRKYSNWLLFERCGLIPVALWWCDLGNAVFNSLVRSHNDLVVPTGAKKVVVSMDEMSLFYSSKTRMPMNSLWDICSYGMVNSHPSDTFEECLQLLAEYYCDHLEAPATTRAGMFKQEAAYVHHLKWHNTFVHESFVSAVKSLFKWCDQIRIQQVISRGQLDD
jgi:hypothetical protein